MRYSSTTLEVKHTHSERATEKCLGSLCQLGPPVSPSMTCINQLSPAAPASCLGRGAAMTCAFAPVKTLFSRPWIAQARRSASAMRQMS